MHTLWHNTIEKNVAFVVKILKVTEIVKYGMLCVSKTRLPLFGDLTSVLEGDPELIPSTARDSG